MLSSKATRWWAGASIGVRGFRICMAHTFLPIQFPGTFGEGTPPAGWLIELRVCREYVGIVSTGSDPSNQDLLFAHYNSGRILRLTTGDVTATFPATLSETNLFADLTDLSPNPGLLPYEPNLPFWSDYAIKRRWFGIPSTEPMTWARDGNWIFPRRMLWVKHFDLEMTRGNPATKRRIETRMSLETIQEAPTVSATVGMTRRRKRRSCRMLVSISTLTSLKMVRTIRSAGKFPAARVA